MANAAEESLMSDGWEGAAVTGYPVFRREARVPGSVRVPPSPLPVSGVRPASLFAQKMRANSSASSGKG